MGNRPAKLGVCKTGQPSKPPDGYSASSPEASPNHYNTHADEESRFVTHLMMSRVRHQVVRQKLNWMHVFSMFDRKSEGLLNEADFSRAMTAMHLGLSHQEIKDLFTALRNPPAAGTSAQNGVQVGQSIHVSSFARALNSIPLAVTQVEEWGANQLLAVAVSEAKTGGRTLFSGH